MSLKVRIRRVTDIIRADVELYKMATNKKIKWLLRHGFQLMLRLSVIEFLSLILVVKM
jgi:hypothetical protein